MKGPGVAKIATIREVGDRRVAAMESTTVCPKTEVASAQEGRVVEADFVPLCTARANAHRVIMEGGDVVG